MSETHLYRVRERRGTTLVLEARIGHPDVSLLPASAAEVLYQLFVSTKYANDGRDEPPPNAYEHFRAGAAAARTLLERLVGTTAEELPVVETRAQLEASNLQAAPAIASVTLTLEPPDAEVTKRSAIGVVLPDDCEAYGVLTIEVTDPHLITHLDSGMYWDTANITIDDGPHETMDDAVEPAP